jgi:NAD+ kinase
MILGVRGTIRDDGIREILPRIGGCLRRHGLDWCVARELLQRGGLAADELRPAPVCSVPEHELDRHSDLILSLGGDGSLLGAVSQMSRDLPVLGVHMGSMGYLTATTPERLEECFADLVAGRLIEERRMMLRVSVHLEGETFEADALNDVVLASAKPGRIVRLTCRINGERLFAVSGDGLIHATPTGSTAYNLGGGGPILDPAMQAIVLTPIMPHSISVRPIVAAAEARIETLGQSRHGRMLLSVDGQRIRRIEPGSLVRVERSPRSVRLLNSPRPGFIGVLRSKLKWNLEDA